MFAAAARDRNPGQESDMLQLPTSGRAAYQAGCGSTGRASCSESVFEFGEQLEGRGAHEGVAEQEAIVVGGNPGLLPANSDAWQNSGAP